MSDMTDDELSESMWKDGIQLAERMNNAACIGEPTVVAMIAAAILLAECAADAGLPQETAESTFRVAWKARAKLPTEPIGDA